MPPIFHLNKPS